MMPNYPSYRRRTTAKPTCPEEAEVACTHCNLFGFLQLFEKLQLESRHAFLSTHRPVAKDEILFRSDSPFHGIYAVKSGSFKSYTVTDSDPKDQIQSFHLPGELLGLDAIRSELYGYYAVALEESSVCLLTLQQLDLLAEHMPQFQEQVIKILVEQVRHDQRQTQLSGRRTAGERLGAFFLNLRDRYAQRGLANDEFCMPMLQNDIANYLGLSMETVSRTLKIFRDHNLLTITGKRVRILDPTSLQTMELNQLGPLKARS